MVQIVIQIPIVIGICPSQAMPNGKSSDPHTSRAQTEGQKSAANFSTHMQEYTVTY